MMDQRSIRDKTNELINQVRNDILDLQDWLYQKLVWYERRYSNVPRESGWPWPGASDVWLPLSDLYINRIKATYMNLLFGGRRTSTMVPVNEQGFANQNAAQMQMEHILRGKGVNAMPDLEFQAAAIIDSACQFGLGIAKTYYSYKTRAATETLRRDDMPGILSRLIVIPNLTDQERREYQMRFPAINPPEFQAIFGTLDVNPMNREVFDRLGSVIEEEVVSMFGLDLEENEDKVARDEIMEYLRTGTRDRSIAVTKKEVLEDCPRIINVPIQDLIVPAGAMLDLSRVDRITQRLFLTPEELKQRAKDEMWDKEAADEALEAGMLGTLHQAGDTDILSFEQLQRSHDEAFVGDQEQVELWSTWTFEEVHRKGCPELVQIVYEPNSGATLYKAPFAPDHGQLPFTVIPFEVNELTYKSPRGIPQILSDIESHVSAWHRRLEDNMLIGTTLTAAVSRNTIDNPNGIEPYPGLMIPTDDPQGDIKPIAWPQTDISIERLEQFYMHWPERLIGALDAENLQANAPERRTATEVSLIDSTRQRLVGMRATLFLKAWSRPLQQCWLLQKQFGPRTSFVYVSGEPPVRLTQSQTRGRFTVEAYFASGPMDPGFRQQQALAIVQTLAQLQPILANDPRFVLDLGQAVNDWLQEADPAKARRVLKVRSPEEQQQMIQQQQQQAQMLSEYEQIAERARMNAPITDDEGERLLRYIKSQLPHKELQQVIAAAKAAAEVARDNTDLLA